MAEVTREQALENALKTIEKEFGKGFSRSKLQNMRLFLRSYPICQIVSGRLQKGS